MSAPEPREAVEPLTDAELALHAARHHLQADGALERPLLCLAVNEAIKAITDYKATISERDARIAVLVESLKTLHYSARSYAGDTGLYSDAPLWEEIEKADAVLSDLPTAARALLDRVEKAEGLWKRLLRLTPDGSEYYRGYPNCVIDEEAVTAFLERHHHSKLEMAQRHKSELEALTEQVAALEKERRTPGTVEKCSRCPIHDIPGQMPVAEYGRTECGSPKCPIRASAPSAGKEG